MKMKSVVLIIAGLSATAGVGYACYDLGLQRGIQEGYYAHAMHTQNQITALRAIRAGDIKTGLLMLEVTVDAGVTFMTAHREMQFDLTASSVHEALSKVRQYRTAYPWNDGNPEIKAKVDSILSKSSPNETK